MVTTTPSVLGRGPAERSNLFPQTVSSWGSILERKELATLTGRAPELCGWALWLGLVLLLAAPLNSVNSVAGPCPPLVLLLAAPLNSVNFVAGLCGWALWRTL